MSPQLTRATLQSLMDTCRGLDPIEPDLPVLVPGDRSLSIYSTTFYILAYLSTSKVILYITLSTFLNHLITEAVVARLQWTREVESFIRRSRYRTCWSWLRSSECSPPQYWTEKRVDYDNY